ncbi:MULTISPECIES: aldo/keto reductase [Acidithrix]|uniref:General stress protein 69 n=1 Tax=Acidithrix ferrooxidans TaxID=1280514 RepID=A0A0D8HDS0_9ACTN|nr:MULTISPECIES: aldo/keto reductase [Acidithrix]KJF16029.1 general stress protein 69 [Acidithrix ferrooxidans]CAG4911127.1 unnamed protein product [Acidithrix sp. C25]
METRRLGRTKKNVSIIGLGTWQLGADWGDVTKESATALLEAAYEGGVTFFDTADVYGDGRSETIIGDFLAKIDRETITVATKMGRRASQSIGEFNRKNFVDWIDRSRTNLGVDRLDLTQLHCPPDDVYDSDHIFDELDSLVEEGRIGAYGVSVETCSQALRAISRPNVETIQIIFNAFRLKPLDEVFAAAKENGVGIIARVPLASGLLSGRYNSKTQFAPDDHRTYNRHGEAFDVGETFSGVDYEVGLRVSTQFSSLQNEITPSKAAIAWIAFHEEVSTVIPGARNIEQLMQNIDSANHLEVGRSIDRDVHEIYDTFLRKAIHSRW